MQLHKLEIKGFKSFADRITIHFDQGITGIVGPNGCGKSNVVDAIRWVLGEQKTKALRSDKMDNVIFNGTRTRKPLQMAEVSLTFHNNRSLLPTEYSHVTITRRYYRTGESEYLLNNVTCRLRDITNLFLDTGIGPDSYAIIELKMVDDILNDKDNSRRGLFEEAAGISKFKVRKKETLRKLEDTGTDLGRVEDLLAEISKNLKTLERQARQAEQYFKLKEEHKTLSIEFARRTVARQREAFLSLTGRLGGETGRRAGLLSQIAEAEKVIEQEKEGVTGKEKLFSARQKALNEHISTVRQYESEKRLERERLRLLMERVSSLKVQLSFDRGQVDTSTAEISRLEGEREKARQALLQLKETVAELQESYLSQKDQAARLQRELQAMNSSWRTGQNEVFSLNKLLEIKQMQVSSLKQELEKAASADATGQASLEAFDENLFELGSRLSEKNGQLADWQEEMQDLLVRLEDTEHDAETVQQEIAGLNRQLDARQNEYSLTKSMVDNLEGYPEAVQFLKKSNKWDKGTPLVSDILTCPDPYRVALENYLEPVMNYYVVQTEEQAYQAIRLLGEAGKGKANFFILDRLTSFQPHSPQPDTLADGVAAAASVVESRALYRNLVAHLLDNVYFVEEDFQRPPSPAGAVFLSRSGKLISRRFSLSGGSVGLFEGKRIGRARNLENLRQEIGLLNNKLGGLTVRQRELEGLREEMLARRNSLNARISGQAKETEVLNREIVALRARKEQLSLTLQNQLLRRGDILAQLEDLQETVAGLQPEAEEKAVSMKGLEAQLAGLNRQLEAQNELVTVNSNACNAENIRFHQAQNRLASLEQEISFHRSTLGKTSDRLENNTEELARAQADVEHLTETSETGDDQLASMYHEKDTIEAGVNEAEKEYYSARGLIDKLEKESRDLQRQRELTDSVILELQGKLNETRLQLTSVKDRLSVEFNVDLDALMEEDGRSETGDGRPEEEKGITGKGKDKNQMPSPAAPQTLSEEEIRARVTDVKSRLEKIGPINPMALEAYEEIKTRYDFINGQKNDLLNARNSLLNTISEIDNVARETFMNAFKQIRQNFIRVFRSLFSEEDSCDLKLSHPENPLESSIDIIAKPKGKRPVTINQLSGGEKTLTATSLLFAIYLLKPAPFCIFDEVDAPLDDANIDKFNNIIRKFSDESQFIIVTHNKRTMVATDIIYGITQTDGDIGVSKVVAVDLRELAES